MSYYLGLPSNLQLGVSEFVTPAGVGTVANIVGAAGVGFRYRVWATYLQGTNYSGFPGGRIVSIWRDSVGLGFFGGWSGEAAYGYPMTQYYPGGYQIPNDNAGLQVVVTPQNASQHLAWVWYTTEPVT